MVNSKKRDILERYRALLENNIVLTDNLLGWLNDRRVLPEFVFDDIRVISSPAERNKKFLTSIMENGDTAYTKLAEGLIANGQPFLGEFLETEDKKVSDSSDEASGRIVIGDEILKKCPGIDKLSSNTRDKLKTYLQEQLLKAHLNETWQSQGQGKSVELINLKRQHYETRQQLVETVEEEKRVVNNLKESLRHEQFVRQQKEEEVKELRNELGKIQSDHDQKWSSQLKMTDANTRSIFKMNDKMTVLNDWFRSIDDILKLSISQTQTGVEFDSAEQLQTKLKRYATEIEILRSAGIGTEKMKEEIYESLYTSRYLPITDRKNQPFHDLLVRFYGANQVNELSAICTKDVLQVKLERDQANDIRLRDIKIDELNRLNRDLQTEIDRLKTKPAPAAPPSPPAEQPTIKPNKPVWRPTPISKAVPHREKLQARQTLKPISVQFNGKPPT
ncbi:unnamed protein product [Adineta steineri]|uniref:CARD domain-containing protein n=1 Tax=Adineta steineri TaxID=433720 RepID=A0A815FRS0_9BILA|nr:unnamed protein product [Adineta steineri]CAF1589340.1 unnamed protein product [Adineta steineri]